MKIIILGAGQVGASLAASLADEHNDITVVDNHSDALNLIKERHDLRVSEGGSDLRQLVGESLDPLRP